MQLCHDMELPKSPARGDLVAHSLIRSKLPLMNYQSLTLPVHTQDTYAVCAEGLAL